MPHDLVVRSGLVIDGSGSDPRYADVAVDDGLIVQVGTVPESGRVELDASGQAVTPGFIDGHTHMDAQVMWDELGSSSCWHGVTTAVMGNCGFSLAPVKSSERALVVRNLERAEDISATAMAEGISWSWETFAEYLDAVQHRPKAINYAAYVGHSALRTWAMGERAFDQPATPADLAAMRQQLAEALDAGAIGLSTSRSANHETADDRPVASRLAAWDEVRSLVDVLAQRRRGVFELALESAARSSDAADRRSFFGRLEALAQETSVPITFGVLGGRDEGLLPLIESVNANGGRIFGQSHCRGIAGLLSFRTTLPFDSLDAWRPLRSKPLAAQLRDLSDPAVRARLVSAAADGPYPRAIGAESRKPDFDRLLVMDTPLPPYRTVSELAAERQTSPVEVMIDLAIASAGDQFFIQQLSPADPDGILAFLVHPDTVMTFSDAGAHVSQISDSSIHTHFLAYWIRERSAFSWAEGIRMITSVPAAAWGFRDRGRIHPGLAADLNVLDPSVVGPAMPTVAHDLPGGARRLVQGSVGISTTIVGGQVTVQDGVSTAARPGRLLRNAAHHGVNR